MASKSNVYAGVAGNAARPDQKGTVGVFARPAETGRWEHVLTGHETYTVNVHPTNPNVVFAGTADGVYRSTDRGKSFQRTDFPDKGVQIWSFLVDANDRKLVYAGGSPISMYRSEDTGETWRALPNPGMPDRAVMPFACRVMRMAQHPSQAGTIFAALEVNGVMRTANGGESWSDCSTDLIRLAQQPHLKSKIVSDTYNEGMLDGHAIAISPADPEQGDPRGEDGTVRDERRRPDLGRYGGRAVLAHHVWPRHQGFAARREHALRGFERGRFEQGWRALSQYRQGLDVETF